MKHIFFILALAVVLMYSKARPGLFGDAINYMQGAVSAPADAFAQCVKSGLSPEVCQAKIKETFHIIVPIFY